ncbi:MAG: hypothetical protein R2708_29065 [Vicinamibacterales bacterium]
MFRRSVVGLGALLGGFHLWLLGNQAWNGQLAEPDVVVRWVLAIALAGGLVALKRRGASLFSRQAVALWVLAALLHGPALGNDHDGFATPALPEAVVTVAQAVAAISAVGLALLAWFVRTAGVFGAVVGFASPAAEAGLPTRRDACQLRFLPRPPPLA